MLRNDYITKEIVGRKDTYFRTAELYIYNSLIVDTAFLSKTSDDAADTTNCGKEFHKETIKIYKQFVTRSKDTLQKLLLNHSSID